MVFRSQIRSNRTNRNWHLDGSNIEVVTDYKYLGFTITHNLNLGAHFKDKVKIAKAAINCMWSNFFKSSSIDASTKFKVFEATIKSSLLYASEVYGYKELEVIELVQRYFFKRIFRLPPNTPNYAIYIESGLPPVYLKNLKANADYIVKVMRRPNNNIQKKIILIALRGRYSPFKDWFDLASEYNYPLSLSIDNLEALRNELYDLISIIDETMYRKSITRARESVTRTTYSKLSLCLGYDNYFRNEFTASEISLIFKMRVEMLELNYRPHRNDLNPNCSLCNLNQAENISHFLAFCPIIQEIRRLYFNKSFLTTEECSAILNGESGWKTLIRFVSEALAYRNMYINF